MTERKDRSKRHIVFREIFALTSEEGVSGLLKLNMEWLELLALCPFSELCRLLGIKRCKPEHKMMERSPGLLGCLSFSLQEQIPTMLLPALFCSPWYKLCVTPTEALFLPLWL